MKILLVTDSNGQKLKPELLKPAPDARVDIAHEKFTIKDALDAVETVPNAENPEPLLMLFFRWV